MSDILYSRKAYGKLLLIGEYFVLDGAESLAIPTKYGQSMVVSSSDRFSWLSLDHNGIPWLSLSENDSPSTFNSSQKKLLEILHSVSDKLPPNEFRIQSDFPLEWGLGSSSTLIALVADYFRVNPYLLNHKLFQGSGYDIACAYAATPILYFNRENKYSPQIGEVSLHPSITDHLYFVYLGQKKNSREAINHYQNTLHSPNLADEVSHLTRELISLQNPSDWIRILTVYDDIISNNLQLEKVTECQLQGLPYYAKYLGAWGGDFAMIITENPKGDISTILSELGYSTFFSYRELMVSN